jgi:hypothetical protein
LDHSEGFQGLIAGDYIAAWMILEGGYEAAVIEMTSRVRTQRRGAGIVLTDGGQKE